jgi:hypothetical protein
MWATNLTWILRPSSLCKVYPFAQIKLNLGSSFRKERGSPMQGPLCPVIELGSVKESVLKIYF